MILIVVVVLAVLLRYLELGPFASISWWWIAGLVFFAFIWFEYLERMFGLDQRVKAHDKLEKAREARVKNTFK